MISYKEATAVVESPVLSHKELKAQEEIEALIDYQIEQQFSNSTYIEIPENEFNDPLVGIPIKRRQIIILSLKNLYKQGGWDLKYDTDNCSYLLTGIQS